MAYVRSWTENQQALAGESPGAGEIHLTGSAPTAPTTTQTSTTQTTETAPSRTASTALSGGGGSALTPGRSLDRTSRDLGEISTGLEGLSASFREAAGPSRSFGEQERQTLQGAIGGDPSAVEATRNLLSAQYQGPQGLDQEEVGRLSSEADQLSGYLGALSRKQGLSGYVLGSTPGLTRGQARFEAESLARDPNFFAQAREQARQANLLGERLRSEEEAARSFAEQRAQEEKALREAAHGFIGEQEAALRSPLEQRVSETNAAQRALEEAFGRFAETGDLSALQGQADAEALGGFDTWTRQRVAQAQAKRDEIMSKYGDIEHIPIADVNVFGEGAERWLVPIRGKQYDIMALTRGEQVIDGMSRDESIALGNRLAQRQTELDLSFSPIRVLRQNRQEFGDILPLYYGQEFAAPDVRNYIELDPGTQATLENLATEEEIAKLNQIAELLGRNERLERREFDPTSLVLRPEEYQRAERRALEDHLQRLRAAETGQLAASRSLNQAARERGGLLGSIGSALGI